MIPLIYSDQASTFFNVFIGEIKYNNDKILDKIVEITNKDELRNKCKNAIILMPFIDEHINKSKNLLINMLKDEERSTSPDNAKIILLEILIQSKRSRSIFSKKKEVKDYSFIYFESKVDTENKEQNDDKLNLNQYYCFSIPQE